MKNKVVSVIITTYGKRKKLLLEAVESVINQTYDSIELIVVDDNGLGSEQQLENEKILRKYKNLLYKCNEKNLGVQYSRNVGILNSKGEYIAFLDDDDIWNAEKISKQVELMESENVDMVFCNGYRFKNDDIRNTVIYQRNFISDRDVTYEMELISDRIGSTSNPLIKRECFNLAGIFDTNLPARQDYDMWLRICKNYRVRGIDEALFYYRSHEGTRITKSEKKSFESHVILWNKYKKDFLKVKEAKTNVMLTLAISTFKMRKIKTTFIFFIRAFIFAPIYTLNFVFWKKNRF